MPTGFVACVTYVLALSCVRQVSAQQTPVITEHGIYAVHLLRHEIGTEEYTLTDTGQGRRLLITTATSDRGEARKSQTIVTLDENSSPTKLEQHLISSDQPASSDAGSETLIRGTEASMQEGELHRVLTKPIIAFAGAPRMPAALQMMMMRYWMQHGRPRLLPLLRGNSQGPPLEIRLVGHEAFTARHRVIRLARYTISNLVFGREVLWMNDSNRVAAVMTFAGGLPQEEVLDEYAQASDFIFQSGVRQEMIDLGELSHAVPPEAAGSFALVGARLIDGTGAPALERSIVIVRDGRIVAAGSESTVAVPPNMRAIHVEGKSVLPGLWDMHVHYSGVEFGPALLAAGITTARDCGGEFDFLTQVRKAIDSQHALGPRLLLAGLVDSGGPLAFGAFDVETPAQALEVVNLYADSHFDQIEIGAQISSFMLRILAEQAHRRGLSVVGHVPTQDDVAASVADGLDEIDDVEAITKSMLPKSSKEPFDTSMLNTEQAGKLIALLAARQVVVDSTLASEKVATPSSPAVTLALVNAGIPTVAGGDTDPRGYGLNRELESYVQAGMTPMQAIQAATIVSARAMKRDSDSGTIEVGKRADLVLVDGNPLANISDLSRVVGVVVNGRLFDSRKLAHSVGVSR